MHSTMGHAYSPTGCSGARYSTPRLRLDKAFLTVLAFQQAYTNAVSVYHISAYPPNHCISIHHLLEHWTCDACAMLCYQLTLLLLQLLKHIRITLHNNRRKCYSVLHLVMYLALQLSEFTSTRRLTIPLRMFAT